MELFGLSIDRLTATLQEVGPRVVSGIVIAVLGYLVAKVLTVMIRMAMRRAGVDRSLASFLGSAAFLLFMGLVAVAAVGKMGMESVSFAAVVGALGLAIGLAFKDTLANFAAGVILILIRPFRVGDVVEIGAISGTVEEIDVFATEVRTHDNKRVVIPNGKITADSMVNYTAHERRRIDLMVQVDYAEDLALVKKTLHAVLEADPRVLANPEPVVAVAELADSGVDLVVRPWARTEEYWDVRFALTESIKEAFEAADISIPYPQQEIRLRSDQDS